MHAQELIAGAPAALIGPLDVVAISIDRYLTGAQREVIGTHFQKKLPNNQVIILDKGMTIQVWRDANAAAAA